MVEAISHGIGGLVGTLASAAIVWKKVIRLKNGYKNSPEIKNISF
jgi:hypothetical protein